MSNPFKEQFLKKGLVTKKQANKVSHEQRLAAPKKKEGQRPEPDDRDKRIQQMRQEQAALDRERNRLRDEAAKKKELLSQIQLIIQQNQLELKGDITFHFADNNKIKKLFVDPKTAAGLAQGELAIVKQDDHYAVVPAKAARQIQERNPDSLLLLHTPASHQKDQDDPYAQFPIPDEYNW